MKMLRWKSIVAPGEAYHVARAHMRGRLPRTLHTHDFPEVFWVESGVGIHVCNGRKLPLQRGSLVTLRPRDCHGFRCVDAAGFVLVNAAFPRETLAHVRARYFPHEARFFWAKGPQPCALLLGAGRLQWLRGWTDVLDRAPRTRLEGERFLLELLRELATEPSPGPGAGGPAWLETALAGMRAPANLLAGTQALARLAGRTPQHVARTLKARCGTTPTEVVNRARLEHAAMQLRMGTEKIAAVAFESGFQNLGHFYAVFNRQFGTTPRRYRLRHQSVVR